MMFVVAKTIWTKPTAEAKKTNHKRRHDVTEYYEKVSRFRLESHPTADDIDADKMSRLPALAEYYYSKDLLRFGWEGVLKALFSGTRDKESPLKLLRDYEATILREAHSSLAYLGARHVKLTIPAALVGRGETIPGCNSPLADVV
ncbi:unnamed protein product [Cylindrotheca closterium]|uniref:Uncharacterized protein n=1 Tax=Cylindrotheca closterium TaxID=2856 RepID=A0AAD2FIN3_9STRA|nr:unnamed protein product [Cylindrotheca closterium]